MLKELEELLELFPESHYTYIQKMKQRVNK